MGANYSTREPGVLPCTDFADPILWLAHEQQAITTSPLLTLPSAIL